MHVVLINASNTSIKTRQVVLAPRLPAAIAPAAAAAATTTTTPYRSEMGSDKRQG
jgi:hypothetical protein